MRKQKTTAGLCHAAIIAAAYFVITYACAIIGLSSGVVQLRLSEALCVLPAFTPYAIPGLFVGCLLSNMLTSGIVLDAVFGSLATLLGAIGTYFIGKKSAALAVLPPIAANTLIIPPVLALTYGVAGTSTIWLMLVFVGVSECLSAGVLGIFFYRMLKRIPNIFG